MTKAKKRSLVQWAVIGVLGLLSVVSITSAFSGSAQNVAEEGDINVYNGSLGADGLGSDLVLGASGTRFPNGISADSTSPAAGEVRASDLTATDDLTVADDASVTGDLSVSGESSIQGFTQGGGCWATSTLATSHTVTQQNLLDYNCFEITWNTGSGTWTLPATSTLTTLLPNVGDTRSWYFENATTTAATTFTIAAGTGIDLFAVTANDDVIDGTESSQMTCIRKTDTDVDCIVNELLAAD